MEKRWIYGGADDRPPHRVLSELCNASSGKKTLFNRCGIFPLCSASFQRIHFLFDLLFRVLSLILAETYHREKQNTTQEQNKCTLGYLNNQYPNARTNYNNSMKHLRKTYQKPVFSFEAGQFEVLPDFRELSDFHGISEPVNYALIQTKVIALGLEDQWERYVEASGELARICYREEIEAAMRTEELSGISLLGLQDFPGQGTALAGMLNSHLQPKPFARPENFRKFFCDTLPLSLTGIDKLPVWH